VKGKDRNAWESSHYPAYKAACNARNDIALEVFDQRDHNEVLSMAEAMSMRFKETELQEIFSRCEQATRTNNIISYLKAEDVEAKGKAAASIRQMIEFERRDASSPSKTAQQAYHSGIDFKELQKTAFEYGRASLLKGLSSEKEVRIYHALEAYENAFRPANRVFKDCIEESKEKTTPALMVKPWETEKYKEYLSLVAIQDEKAYELVKGNDLTSINNIAKEMGISPKRLDVEAHRHSLRQTLQTYLEGDRTNVPMAAREVLNWLEFDRHSDHKHTFKVLREQDLWPNDIQKGLQEFFEKKREWRQEEQRGVKDAAKASAQGHALIKPEYRTITYERHQSFEEVDKQLKEKIFELATSILGKPLKNSGRDYVEFKSPVGKVSVAMRGAKVGVYTNFRSGVKGGPLKLIEDQMGLASTRDALKWASEWLGGNPLVIEHRVVEKQQNEAKFSTWTPITPVPKEAVSPDIEGNKYLNYMLKDGNKEVSRHAYRDEQGNLKGYVFRIEKADGSKITPPLAYCQNERGFKAWKWQAFEKENKTPYGIEKLAQNPDKPILVVEGEKTADATQKLLPEYNVLTWGGGAGNVGKTNWECLANREVVIWPDYDYDQGGQIAAEKLQKIVTNLNKEDGIEGSVRIVKLPPLTPGQTPLLPNKWDLADKLPEDWTLNTVKEMITEALPPREIVHTQKHTEPNINIEKAANQFVDLCVLYESLSWDDPRDSETLRKIEAVAGKNMHNEEFRHRIESCGNDMVIERLHAEMEDQKHLLIQDNHDSGVINEATLSLGDIGADHKAVSSIERAANEFIDLCVLYESLSWDDPNDSKTLRQIEAVAGKYMNNEEFRQRVEASKNEVAINRLEIEIEEQKQNMSQSMSRGI